MTHPDLFQAADQAAPEPEWVELPTPRGRYRWRLWPDRVPREWRDQKDAVHPDLLYRPPFTAFELEVWKDGHWQAVRFGPAVWEVWQTVRLEAPWET